MHQIELLKLISLIVQSEIKLFIIYLGYNLLIYFL